MVKVDVLVLSARARWTVEAAATFSQGAAPRSSRASMACSC